MPVSQDELTLLDIAARLTALSISKVNVQNPLDQNLSQPATQQLNLQIAGTLHTFYSALVAVVADTTDWPVPAAPPVVRPGSGASGSSGSTTPPASTSTTPPASTGSVNTSALVAQLKALLAAAGG